VATWASRIPAIKHAVGLSQAGLGLTLLGGAVGALLAMNVAGFLTARWGSRPVAIVTTLAVCGSLPLLALAQTPVALFTALFLLGATIGSMDVAMNAQAVAVERRLDRPILSSFHGMYSLGGLAGALAGGVAAGLGFDPLANFAAAAIVSLCIAVPAFAWLLPAGVDSAGAGVTFSLPSRAVLTVGLIAFCTVVGEGAVADWSAVYLRSEADATAAVAAFGFASFSLTMAASRFAGDRLNARFGPSNMVRWGGLVAAVGFLVVIAVPVPFVAIAGFGLAGMGFSSIFPIAISAAGRIPSVASGTAIAAVATCGYTGFLIGPPVIGFIAQATSLRFGLGVVVALSLLAAALAPAANGEVDQRPEQQEQFVGLEF
jgi:MFS family permease